MDSFWLHIGEKWIFNPFSFPIFSSIIVEIVLGYGSLGIRGKISSQAVGRPAKRTAGARIDLGREQPDRTFYTILVLEKLFFFSVLLVFWGSKTLKCSVADGAS